LSISLLLSISYCCRYPYCSAVVRLVKPQSKEKDTSSAQVTPSKQATPSHSTPGAEAQRQSGTPPHLDLSRLVKWR
jgi:hypothetical protein